MNNEQKCEDANCADAIYPCDYHAALRLDEQEPLSLEYVQALARLACRCGPITVDSVLDVHEYLAQDLYPGNLDRALYYRSGLR